MASYVGSFQPGLNFNPVNRAEIVSRLHGKFQPGMSKNFISNRGEISARTETIKPQNGAKMMFTSLLFDFCETVVAFKNTTDRNKAT
jgi:hypothetical protein